MELILAKRFKKKDKPGKLHKNATQNRFITTSRLFSFKKQNLCK